MASDNSNFSNIEKKKKISDNFTSSQMNDPSQLIDNCTDSEVLSQPEIRDDISSYDRDEEVKKSKKNMFFN